jgi:hypothetical protein
MSSFLLQHQLISFQKFVHKSRHSIQTIFRLIQINLMERKPIEGLIAEKLKKPDQTTLQAQMCLFKI